MKAMLNVREICDNVRYVGVNDRTTSRFEALWPIPSGVSYNSYFVQGSEKNALIDTVEIGHLPAFLDNLRMAGVDRIDYLVVNHMEPDHSGSIPEILKVFPEMKIIGNRQTISMIGGYYKITDPSFFLEVKEGDCVSLGDVSLSFSLIPMVHWPETMVTYVRERGLLFSGDAFGCFGALNGGIVDNEMDVAPYFPQMERYYACIVGKYGKFVQRAILKLKDLKLDYVCPTHGPVWHEEIHRVIGLYDRFSRYEAEEGVTIVYGSMYGNTASVAEIIANELASCGIRKIRIHNASFASLDEMITDVFRYKGLIIGAPTYSMHLFPPVEQLLIALETREIKDRVFGSFGSFTWSTAVPGAIGAYLEKMGLESAGHIDMKQSADNNVIESARELARKIAEAIKQ